MSASTNRNRWVMGLGVAVTAALALPALAETPATNNQNGLMTFPNVRVVDAPAPVKAAPVTDQGMRAAIDAETGRLRQVTADEAQQLTPKKPAKVALRGARTAAVESAATDEGQLLYGPGNAVGATLGEESMIYHVARKADEGIEMEEHTGKSNAEKVVQANAKQPAASEHTNKKEAAHAH